MSPNNKMKPPPNYYKLLGVSSTATTSEITRAYHKKILEVHVDKCPNKNPNLCYETIEAYRILSNQNARTKYDIQRDSLRFLTDRELVDRYKADLTPGEAVTPEIILKLREKYNLERTEQLETFIPAGALEYNVEDQLSSILLKKIQAWETDFSEVKGGALRDNYFECYSSLVNKVLRSNSTTNQFWCTTCDKNFLNSEQHSEEVLQSYLHFFNSDKQNLNVTSIYDFFHLQFGKLFTWEPEYLPKKPLGIWGRPEWLDFPIIQLVFREKVSELLPAVFFEDMSEHMKYVQATVDQPAAEYMCWMLEYNDVPELNDMAKSVLCSNNLSEILIFIAVLCEFLAFSDWEGLCNEALAEGEIELTVLWMKVRELLGLAKKNDWIHLGITIHSYKDDPFLSHFCFLLEPNADWDLVSSYFTEDGDHLTAITYQLYAEKPSAILQTYLKLCDTDRKSAQIYRNVYYSKKIRDILLNLVRNRNLIDLEELIGIIQILFPDPSEPFKLIVNIYSEYFKDPVFNPIHRHAMEQIQAMPITFSTLKLILGALHYLPADEIDADEYFLASNWSRLCRNELERSLSTSDFEKLTRVLLNLNRWSVPAANEVLREILEPGEETLSSHVRGMMLLLRGTIQKLDKNWIGATTDFQAALLNTPECLYRLTPCVSQLTQDIEYHEGILGQVQDSLLNLKENFDDQNYIEIDTSVHSLVVTDVVPQEEFGYKDLASRIQLEPPPLRDETQDIQGEREQPPVETNTPQVTMDKVERAIEVGADQNKPMDALSSALAYVNLLKALPQNLHHGPIVMAASHFLRAMNETDNPTSLYAYRNAILDMAGKLLGLDRQVSARVQSCLTHKHMFSIALMANQRLSQCVGTDEIKSDISSQLISNSETEVLETLLRSVVGSSQVEPLANIPTLSCSDLSYVEKVKTHYLQAFCTDKIQQKYQSACIPSHVHAYTLFLETWRGRCSSSNFEKTRTVAMDTFLKHHGCTMEDMRMFMEIGNDDPDGILLRYGVIDGFKINLVTGEVSFLLARGNVFTAKDLLEVFENGIENATLSLEHPEQELQSHPCKEACFQPEGLAGTDYMKCLLRTSMLLHSFVTGVEICRNPPFGSMLVYQSLFEGLPEHLQYFLRPLKERDSDSQASQLRFWISLTESYEEIEESPSEFIYKVGNVCAEVNADTAEPGSADCQFSSDFTKHFKEIGTYFPEFYKLTELKKMSLIHRKLREILNEKSEELLQNDGDRITQVICNSIRNLGIERDTKNRMSKPKGCVWVPSPSCHIEYPDSYEVLGGVRISGEPIYGPCSASPKSAFVPAQDLIVELDYYKEAIKANQPTRYFTVTVDVNSLNGQQLVTPFSFNPNHYSPDFDYEYGPIQGTDFEVPYESAWTSPTAIPSGTTTQTSRTCPHVSRQSSLATVAEEERNFTEEDQTDDEVEIISVDYDTGIRVLGLQNEESEAIESKEIETESEFSEEEVSNESESELHECIVSQPKICDFKSEASSENDETENSLEESSSDVGEVDVEIDSDISESDTDELSEMLGRVTVQEVLVRVHSMSEVGSKNSNKNQNNEVTGIEVIPSHSISLTPAFNEDNSSSEADDSDLFSDTSDDDDSNGIAAGNNGVSIKLESIDSVCSTNTEIQEIEFDSHPKDTVIPSNCSQLEENQNSPATAVKETIPANEIMTLACPQDQEDEKCTLLSSKILIPGNDSLPDKTNGIEAEVELSETSTDELISNDDTDAEQISSEDMNSNLNFELSPETGILGKLEVRVETVGSEVNKEAKAEVVSDLICDYDSHINPTHNSEDMNVVSKTMAPSDLELTVIQNAVIIKNYNVQPCSPIKTPDNEIIHDFVEINDNEDELCSDSTSDAELESESSGFSIDNENIVGVDSSIPKM